MINRRITHATVSIALLAPLFAVACAVDDPRAEATEAPASEGFALGLASDALSMTEGESVRIYAAPVDGSGQPFRGLFLVKWTTSTSSVADVSGDGLLSARASGTAKVTAIATRTDTGATATASITVTVTGSAGGPAPAPPGDVGTSGALVGTTFATTTADFPSPERGFYGWSGQDFVGSYDAWSVSSAYAAGQRLVFAKVQLDAYRTRDLPAMWLAALGQSFNRVRAAGMKTSLTFGYDFTAGGNDATAAQIKRHLEQLRPVLAANADVIPFMRAGFIGAWGEWHSSKSGNSCGYNAGTTSCAVADANRAIVRDALFANVPATTQIAFRYPVDLQKWYPVPTQQRRAGMHNDCFLAGPSDTGTYQSASQRTYAQLLSDRAAFGGENCHNAETPLRTSCADILSEGAAYHVAWLNGSDWSGFMTAWKNGGCYGEVSRKLGYRLQLDAASHAERVARGGAISVTVDLRNVGWARLFSARPLVVTLVHRGSGATITASAGNLAELAPQATASSRVAVVVPIAPGAEAGTYDVLLSAPDIFPGTAKNPQFSVRFANADNAARAQAWSDAGATFKVGTTVGVQ